MRDPRLDKLAQVLVHHSTRVQPGQLVRLTGDPLAMPLLEALHEQVLRAGAHPLLRLAPAEFRETFLAEAGDAQLDYANPLLLRETELIDASITVWAEANTRSGTRQDPSRAARVARAQQPARELFFRRAAAARQPVPGLRPLHWVGTMFPTQASAQEAEMSLRDYADFVFKAGLLHLPDPAAAWARLRRAQERLIERLQQARTLRFRTAHGTDLSVDVEGMRWIACAGECNFPDGEVFTGPNLAARDGGVNGRVRFSFPCVHQGRVVEDVELVFAGGRLVQATAGRGGEFLDAMLRQDEGAGRVGEIALGTNYAIREFTRNTLFDEKIGGTFHLAMGAGYPETGNTNASALHWDMVCDLRGGGTVEADGETISRDGRFTHPDWPQP